MRRRVRVQPPRGGAGGAGERLTSDVPLTLPGYPYYSPCTRPDGTLRKPVTIWVVRLGNELYVRSGYGRTSTWFRGTQDRHEGHIHAGGVDKDVRFVEA